MSYSNKGVPHQNFAFQNLQPINYLRNFNKMMDYMSKAPSAQISEPVAKQMKIVNFSKFPIHPYYQQMQGIFEGNNKKSNETQKHNKKDLEFQQLEEKFLDKHYNFVKEALSRIIHENQSQQKILLKSKDFYQNNAVKRNKPDYEQSIVRMVRLRSQPKLRSVKNTIDSARKTVQQSTAKEDYSSLTKGGKQNTKRLHQKEMALNKIQLKRKLTRKSNSIMTQIDGKCQNSQYSSMNKVERKTQNNLLNENSEQQQHFNPIFKKLKPPQKNQKFKHRKLQQIQMILSARQSVKGKKESGTIYPSTERTHHQEQGNRKLINQSDILSIKDGYNKRKLYSKNQGFNQQNQEEQINSQSQSKYQPQLQQFRKQISILGQKDKNQLIDTKQKIKARESFQNDDDKFLRDIEILKKKQISTQKQFSSKIQNKIQEINAKLNSRIKQVAKFDFSVRKKDLIASDSKQKNQKKFQKQQIFDRLIQFQVQQQ